MTDESLKILDNKYKLLDLVDNTQQYKVYKACKLSDESLEVLICVLTCITDNEIEFSNFCYNYQQLTKEENLILPIDYGYGIIVENHKLSQKKLYVAFNGYDSLSDYIREPNLTFNENYAKLILIQVLQALKAISYLISKICVPIDLINIYVDNSFTIKVGTPADIYYLSTKKNFKRMKDDSSSLGNLLFNLLNGQNIPRYLLRNMLISKKDPIKLLERYNFTPDFVDFFSRLVSNNNFKDLSDDLNYYMRLLSHPWLNTANNIENIMLIEDFQSRKRKIESQKDAIIDYNNRLKELASSTEDEENQVKRSYNSNFSNSQIFGENLTVKQCTDINKTKSKFHFIFKGIDSKDIQNFMNKLAQNIYEEFTDKCKFNVSEKSYDFLLYLDFSNDFSDDEDDNCDDDNLTPLKHYDSCIDNEVEFTDELLVKFKLFQEKDKYLLNIYHYSGNFFDFYKFFKILQKRITEIG